jgi:anti-sigma B factor antagonist
MDVKSEYLDDKDVTLVVVDGRIDSYTNNFFENELITNIDIGQTKIVLDFKDVSYISSQGLRTIVTALKKAKASGGFLKLAGLTDEVKKIFQISGLIKVLSLFDTVEEAIN